jgi:hypothetical protein
MKVTRWSFPIPMTSAFSKNPMLRSIEIARNHWIALYIAMRRQLLASIMAALFTAGCSQIDVPMVSDDVSGGSQDTAGNTGSCTLDSDCDDKNPCTANRCNTGQCVFPPAQDICVINDACVQSGTISENDQCLTCSPDIETNDWSGRVCDDDNPQTKDSCGSAVGCLFEPINECPEGHAQPDCKECLNGWQDKDNDQVCMPTCEGAELDCGEHGACDDTSGTVLCACDPQYEGALCEDCVETHQDNDGDGTCQPTCANSEIDCGAHGSCDDTGGEAVCTCEEGYEGDFCDQCTEGQQDNDGDGLCTKACSPDDGLCGSYGSCDDSSGSITCACTPGYVGDTCDTCDQGYQDNDNNGTCSIACAVPESVCVGGTCNDSSGTVECDCDSGWTGELCDGCEADYVMLNDVCVPACNPADCGQYETCGDNNQCVCAPGFTIGNASCVWTGVGLDTKFDDPAAWTTTGSAIVQNSVARFPLSCEWASVSATVTMPTYKESIPLLIKVSLLADRTEECSADDCLTLPVFMGFNGHTTNFQHDEIGDIFNHTPVKKDEDTLYFCLPPAAYGGEVEMSFFNGPPVGQIADFKCKGNQFATWAIDEVRLMNDLDGECLIPGKIGDNKFDKQDLSWNLVSDSPDSVAFMQNNQLVLQTYAPCYKASATQEVMSPTDPKGIGKSLALLFDYQASLESDFRLTVGKNNVRRLPAKGLQKMTAQTVCLGKPFVSSNISITFQQSSATDVCDEAAQSIAHVDNVRFEYVEGCQAEEFLVDGGFEAAAEGFVTWGIYQVAEGFVNMQGAKANSGLASAQMTADSPCYKNGVLTWFAVPEATQEAGPAITLVYDRPSDEPYAVARLSVGGLYGPYKLNKSKLDFKQELLDIDLPATDGWKQHTLCLNPNTSGRRAKLDIGLYGGPGNCATLYPPENLWVDDVTIGLDPSCPGL